LESVLGATPRGFESRILRAPHPAICPGARLEGSVGFDYGHLGVRRRRSFPNLSITVAPTDGHNVVVKTDCMLELRNAWVDDPTIDVDDAECFADVKVAWDLP
jgi:hypothetical protein